MMNEKKLHKCESNTRYNFECYEFEDGNLYLSANGEYVEIVRFCPFCGFEDKLYDRERLSGKTSQEDATVRTLEET